MSINELPSSWAAVQLGEVVDYGKTQKAEPDEIPQNAWILELEDVEKDSSRVLNRLTFAERNSRSTKNIFAKGDVLYGKLRPYLNKVLIADDDGFSTTEIIPLKAGQYLDNRFLFYWLKHPDFLEYVSNVSHGMNMPRLGTESGIAAPFILAPLLEQKRIADKLERLLSRVDAARERLERVPGMLKRFRASVLEQAVSGELSREWREENGGLETHTLFQNICNERRKVWENEQTNRGKHNSRYKEPQKLDSDELIDIPENWIWISADQVSSFVTDGEHITPDRQAEGVLLLSARNVQNGSLSLENVDYVSEATYKTIAKRFEAREGDVLLSCSGTVGRSCVVPKGIRFALVRSVAIIRPIFDMGKYISFVFRSPFLQNQIDENQTQTAQANIFQGKIKILALPLPPLLEQTEIIRRVEQLFTLADQLEARYQSAKVQLERLTPALLAKAFRGELVDQDPTDEPASVLLERIKTEREGAGKKALERKPRVSKEKAGTGEEAKKRGRPAKARMDGVEVEDVQAARGKIPQASSVAEGIKQLQHRAMVQTLTKLLREVRDKYIHRTYEVKVELNQVWKGFRSSHPEASVSTFYHVLKEIDQSLVKDVVRNEAPLWEFARED